VSLDLRYYPEVQIRQGADRDSARPMISLQTSYRFDNCHCAGHAKDSDEQQVALHRRKTTTKRSQCREHDQLPHPRVHLQDTFHFAPILEAPRPSNAGQRDGPGLVTTHPSPRAPWPKTTLSKKMRAFDDEVALTVAPFYLVHMLQRTLPAGLIAPCLPTKTDKLPSGSDWRMRSSTTASASLRARRAHR